MRWFKFNWNGKEKSNCPGKVKGKLVSGMDLDWKSTWKMWNSSSYLKSIWVISQTNYNLNFKTSLVRRKKLEQCKKT
jgi:hypothetical protein